MWGPASPACHRRRRRFPCSRPARSATYTVTFAAGINSANLGSSGSPVTFSVGAFKPAKPIATNPFNGYINSAGGVATLHLSSITPLATATGTLGNIISSGRIDDGSGNNPAYTATFVPTTGALTITSAITGGTVAAGQVISGAGIVGQPVIQPGGSGNNWVTTTTTGSTLTGIAIKSGTPGTTMTVTTISPAPTIRYPEVGVGSTITGSGSRLRHPRHELRNRKWIDRDVHRRHLSVCRGGDAHVRQRRFARTGKRSSDKQFFCDRHAWREQWIYDGGLNITGEPLIVTATNTATSTGFSNWVINQTYTPAFTNDAALTATQTALVPGQQVFGPGITTPVSIAGLGSSAGTYTCLTMRMETSARQVRPLLSTRPAFRTVRPLRRVAP